MIRKNIRLKDYDYSCQGAYFITICLNGKNKIFSNICRGDPCGRPDIVLSSIGKIADSAFEYIEKLYNVKFDYRVIMSDHIHFILMLENKATARVAPTVDRVVAAYKSYVSNERRKLLGKQEKTMWQRGYYDHVIRNESDLLETRRYIENNPTTYLLKQNQR